MFEFTEAWVLFFLPLPLLVYYILPAGSTRQTTALKIPFYRRLQQFAPEQKGKTKGNVFWRTILFAVWSLLIIAAANPAWLGKPVSLPRSGRDIMLAVDLSGSMRIPDMTESGRQVDRLAVVKQVASQFIKQRTGDRLGLILFGSKAYLQTPLTYDRKTVVAMLQDATIGLAGQQTAIGDAIGLGIKRLLKYPKDSRVLILLTDGSSNAGAVTPLSAAKLAAKEGIKVYTIGLGADRLEVPSFFGNQVLNPSQDLDVSTLQTIAKTTGGKFFRAKNTKALQSIYKAIDQLEPTISDSAVFRPITTLFMWPLGIALILSFLLGLHKLPWGAWFSRDIQHKEHKV